MHVSASFFFVYIQYFSDYSPLIIILPRRLIVTRFKIVDLLTFLKNVTLKKVVKRLYKDDGRIRIICITDCFITFSS